MYHGRDENLGRYLEAISNHPLLSPEDELRLTRIWAKRNKRKPTRAQLAAREELLRCNMKLVVSVAKSFRGRSMPFMDVIQEGVTGLAKAIDKYDPSRGVKLGTYATWWIRQACQRAVVNYGDTIRIPAQVNIYRARASKLMREHPDMTPEEIAAEIGTDVEHMEEALEVPSVAVSLDSSRQFADESSVSLVNLIEDVSAEDPAEVAIAHDAGRDVRRALTCLLPEERRVIELRFGFEDGYALSFAQVSTRMGIPHHRAQALQKSALHKLGHLLRRDEEEAIGPAPERAPAPRKDYSLSDEPLLGRCGYIGDFDVEDGEEYVC